MSPRRPSPSRPPVLTKRERQIMDVLYRLGRATAGEVGTALPGTPNDSTVRTQLRVLEEKGHLRHEQDGVRYVYVPTVSRTVARRTALTHLIDTFFDGSAAGLLTTLLGSDAARLSDDELDRLAGLVEAARDPAARDTSTPPDDRTAGRARAADTSRGRKRRT